MKAAAWARLSKSFIFNHVKHRQNCHHANISKDQYVYVILVVHVDGSTQHAAVDMAAIMDANYMAISK